MPGSPLSRKRFRLILLAALLTAGCAEPHQPPDPVAMPALTPATTTACTRIGGTDCDEWTPLDPQPTFADLLRLERSGVSAAPGISWSGLYLCGALPEDQLTKHFGADRVRAIVDGYQCVHQSARGTRTMTIRLGAGDFQKWTQPDPGQKRRLTNLLGREAIAVTTTQTKTHFDCGYIVAIPGENQVLIVEVNTYGRPSPWNTTFFAKAMAMFLITLNT